MSGKVIVSTVAGELDRLLCLEKFPGDVSNNGLQTDAPGRAVRKICCGVDASMEFFEAALCAGADMCLVHHGISWGNSLARITGVNYTLVSFLLRHNIALYAAHLPIDANPLYGNNVVLCGYLGLTDVQPFGCYHGMTIGFIGNLPAPVSFPDFLKMTAGMPHVIRTCSFDFGVGEVSRVAVVSGGASDMVEQAASAGADVFVTGETGLQAYNMCRHLRMNMVSAGHYATECGGVERIGRYLSSKLNIESEFIDLKLPY